LGKTPAGAWALRALGRVPVPSAALVAPPPPTLAIEGPTPAKPAPLPVEQTVDFSVYTVEDLFYSGRDLDRAMDLLALCTVED